MELECQTYILYFLLPPAGSFFFWHYGKVLQVQER